MSYTPDFLILEKYAKVLINFALGSGKGVKPEEVVFIVVPEAAKPLLFHLQKQVLLAGAYPIVELTPNETQRPFMELSRQYLELANEKQLNYFPSKLMRGRVDEADHMVSILCETNKKELEGIDPKIIMQRSKAWQPYKEWRFAKEDAGRFTWTLGLYGTQEMAKEAKMSLKAYWNQIIKACYLNEEDPVKKWISVEQEINQIKNKLNLLDIDRIHVQSENIDLYIGMDEHRKWLGGSGRNIPSFEIFTSPDWRRTEGHIKFTEPLYRYGNLIKDVYLEFAEGKVVKSSASSGEEVLKEMIATENADKVGEFSLTDSRLSHITKFMAETLYDENIGGKYGNTHIALGSAYKDAYPGDPSTVAKENWEAWGYNDSIVHTDIVSTENRTVTAELKTGRRVVIYKNGKFRV